MVDVVLSSEKVPLEFRKVAATGQGGNKTQNVAALELNSLHLMPPEDSCQTCRTIHSLFGSTQHLP